MAKDIRHWSQEFFTEFIDLYRNFPCLWQIKCKEYSNKYKKDEALDALVIKCKEVDSTADREFVKKKLILFVWCTIKSAKKLKTQVICRNHS